MKNKRIRILAVITLAFFVLSTAAVFATSRTVGTCQSSFKAVSATSAKAVVKASGNGTTPFITSKIILQSAAIGSATFQNVSGVAAETYTLENATLIHHVCNFPITTDKDYRIKIELTDQVQGIQTTTTYYCNLKK